jgi:peptide deformylase
VRRPRRIRVDSLDREGRPQSIEAEGFISTVASARPVNMQCALMDENSLSI